MHCKKQTIKRYSKEIFNTTNKRHMQNTKHSVENLAM